ncbi:hypothetical protein H5T87_06060 [bacterium]|nr:hypothetical protein [bacterium]
MVLLSEKESLQLKLNCIPLPYLQELASLLGLPPPRQASKIITLLIEKKPDINAIDRFIKIKYQEKIQKRREIISDEELKAELLKVKTFSWGVIQGQLDQKIQTEYVRKIPRYEELLHQVQARLHKDITNYCICTWFNHWTTVLIEEHIASHPKVIPALKNIKDIDLFFGGQPFDLKVTYLPRGYSPQKALENPKELAKWMYENQGEQRFGAGNRMFIVLFNKDDPEKSWKLKREFPLLFQK